MRGGAGANMGPFAVPPGPGLARQGSVFGSSGGLVTEAVRSRDVELALDSSPVSIRVGRAPPCSPIQVQGADRGTTCSLPARPAASWRAVPVDSPAPPLTAQPSRSSLLGAQGGAWRSSAAVMPGGRSWPAGGLPEIRAPSSTPLDPDLDRAQLWRGRPWSPSPSRSGEVRRGLRQSQRRRRRGLRASDNWRKRPCGTSSGPRPARSGLSPWRNRRIPGAVSRCVKFVHSGYLQCSTAAWPTSRRRTRRPPRERRSGIPAVELGQPRADQGQQRQCSSQPVCP